MERRGRIMRHLWVVIPTIAALASPAFAQSARKGKAHRPAHATSPAAGQPRFATDPDPNVRFEIMRQQNWRKGGS
jgi:hypothetical protein